MREDVKVCIPVEDRDVTANSHGSDQTIDELAHCVTPLATSSVERRVCGYPPVCGMPDAVEAPNTLSAAVVNTNGERVSTT